MWSLRATIPPLILARDAFSRLKLRPLNHQYRKANLFWLSLHDTIHKEPVSSLVYCPIYYRLYDGHLACDCLYCIRNLNILPIELRPQYLGYLTHLQPFYILIHYCYDRNTAYSILYHLLYFQQVINILSTPGRT